MTTCCINSRSLSLSLSRYQKCETSLELNEVRDDGVLDAAASAGPYANNLHLAADR